MHTQQVYVSLTMYNVYLAYRKQCWVCYSTNRDDPNLEWVSPCHCSGTTQWIHQMCLLKWINQKQRGDVKIKVHCPLCNTQYNICYPELNRLLLMLDHADEYLTVFAPYCALFSSLYWYSSYSDGFVICSQLVAHQLNKAPIQVMAHPTIIVLYGCSLFYGYVACCQIIGQEQTVNLMESNCGTIVIAFPLIPVLLIIFKSLPLKQIAFQCLVRGVPRMAQWMLEPFGLHAYFQRLYPVTGYEKFPPPKETRTLFRVVCGALTLPSIAVFVGKVLFGSIDDDVRRCLLVG